MAISKDKKLQQLIRKNDAAIGVIVWVEPGGGCSMPQKVLNMEKAGV